MKLIALAIALILSTSAMAHEGGANGGEKVFDRMYQANQAAIARQQ